MASINRALPVVIEQRGRYVTTFSVRNRWEWATIVVRPIIGGAEVLINSSFSTYGYCWGAMGEDWRYFLADLEFDYAMNKLAGRRFRVPLDRDEFVAKMEGELDRYESDVREWRAMDAKTEKRLANAREALEDLDCDIHPHGLFSEWDRGAGGLPYELELYSVTLDKPCPQARGFWDNLWTPFAAQLMRENVALERRWKRELDVAGVCDLTRELAA